MRKRILSFILSSVMALTIVGATPAMVEAAWSQEQYYRESIEAYDGFDYSDPQFIPDEEFFGVWDEETGDWKENYIPYLYYEEYPGLSKVEEAAKAGNYEACKEAVLEYYREKSSAYNMGYPGRSVLTDRNRARAEMAFSNMNNEQSNSEGRTYFTSKEGWHSINVRSDFLQVLGNGETRRMYTAIAADKDGYRVELDRGEHKPYLILEVNGETKRYEATKTTYIDGKISDPSELIEDKMLVEESVTSIGKLYPRDENTKRAFFQFDFPDLTENDVLGSATLHLYGKMVEDDIDEEPPIKRDYKILHVFSWKAETELSHDLNYDKVGEYTEVCYNFDSEIGFRYTTTRITDDPKTAWYQSPFSAAACVTAYQATGDETFAFHGIRQLVSQVLFHGDYEHLCSLNPHGLGETAGWGYGRVWNIDALMSSEYMTPEAFTILLKGTHVKGKWLEEHWIGSYEIGNWGGYAVDGILSIAMLYPEFRDAHGDLWRNEDGSYYLEDPELGGSVRGGWLDVANYRTSYKVGSMMHEDGASFEAPVGYTFEGLLSYLKPKEYGQKLNFDYSQFYIPKVEDESDYIYVGRERMVKALRYLASITTPQGGYFQVGDAGEWNEDALQHFKGFMEFLEDPFIEYIVSKGEEGKKPEFQSVVYDGDEDPDEEPRGGKVAIFRDHWEDETAIAMHFQAWGKANHSHQDDLSLSLVAYDNYLLTDQRMNNYDEEDRLERWVSSTRGHNTIEINDAVGRGEKFYAVQYDPLVFETELNENGEIVPKKDENGVEMIDDPLYVDTAHTSAGVLGGSIHPEDREINRVYDYVRGTSRTYHNCSAESLYNENFDLERDVLFLHSGYFIVTDYGKPEHGIEYNYQDAYQKENNIEGHKYKQLWHFTNLANIEVDTEKNTVKTNFPGAANIIVATVKNNDNMRLQYKYGLYPTRRGVFAVTKYATFEQYKKGAMTFNSLLYPMPVGQDAEITTRQIELDYPEDVANAFKATITDTVHNTDSEIYFYTLYDKTQKAPTTFSSYKTDGTLALGEKKEGNYVNAVLRQGSYLENILDEEYAIYSTEEIEDIGVYWKNDEIDIAFDTNDSYNNDIDLEKITVIANNKVNTVRLNGEEVDFEQDGKYIYFGEEPILDGGDEIPGADEETETGSADGGHATGGSSSGGSSSDDDKKEDEKPQTPPVVEPETTPADAYKEELNNHWAQKEISALINDSIVEGFGDGTLGLDRNITRAQFITMLVRALDVNVEEYKGSFSDVSKNNWHADYIETALKNGWIQGDGTNAYPDRNITREEITKILVSAFEQKYGEITTLTDKTFSDSSDISSWAEEFVNKAASASLINGMGNGEFKPKDNAKREQAMVLIYRLINKK